MVFFAAPRPYHDHVLITGGSKGIGYALAEEFLKRGARVTLLARTKADLEAAEVKLKADASLRPNSAGADAPTPIEVQTVVADIANAQQLSAAISEASRSFGPVDTVVCNAGLSRPGLFLELDEETFARHMEVNYLGAVRTVRAVLPGMLERAHGRVVLVASTLAVTGFAGYSAYAPSKWALRGFGDCLRSELEGTGVGVSVGYPPDTQTPGYDVEDRTKPDICRAVNAALGSELFPPGAVARPFVRDILAGRYHLRGPDLGQNLLVDATAGLSPGVFSAALGAALSLLSPIVDLVLAILRWRGDVAARRANATAARTGSAAG